MSLRFPIMGLRFAVFCWIYLVLSGCYAWAGPDASPSPEASPSATVSDLISTAEAETFLIEFVKAQTTQLKALQHRNQFELSEFKASQGSKYKDWLAHEKELRKAYFESHKTGAEQREYIKFYRQRLKVYRQEMSAAESHKIHELSQGVENLRAEQAKRLQQVRQLLKQGKRPGAQFWPEAGS